MEIVILTYGSRGDVQPFLPLSLRLMEAGHSVKLATPSRFMNLIEGDGIDFVPLAGDPEDLSRRYNDAGYNLIKMLREMMDHAIDIGADILRQTKEACKDADLIIHRLSMQSARIPWHARRTSPIFTCKHSRCLHRRVTIQMSLCPIWDRVP